MQTKVTHESPTELLLIITADEELLAEIKGSVIRRLGADVKVPGFRAGKAPLPLIEKQLNPTVLQNEFLDEAVNGLYSQAVSNESIRPVVRPTIDVKKFVPFTAVEFTAKVSVVGPTKLPDYKKMTIARPKASPVTTKEINEVIERLQAQAAERKDVTRASKLDDQVWLDFKGVDDKGVPVEGAESSNYPLTLGSKAFIPGFEEQVVGLKAGDTKTFKITFPKDYQLKALASKKVTFTITVIKVQELKKPKADDSFAKLAGPFKSLAELKADIKKQLAADKKTQDDREFESEVLKKINDKSKVEIPVALIDAEVERQLRDLQQNLNYRGQTFPEFLEQEKTNEEDYRKNVVRPAAEDRVKASIVLSDIAEAEKIGLTQEEVEERLGQLRVQYTDAQSQEDLGKPEFQRDLASRMLAEKTILKIVDYVTPKK
jgi:trigger factor